MQRIGRYEIASELGRGAMGVVYRARDRKIGREVAIKTIKLADQADPGEIESLRERLFREAQSAGRLSHPGIVTIFDVDEQDGVAYITMELVEGQTLDRYAAGDTARSPGFVADLLVKVGVALDYAHRCEIVHRDIKPSNIMISPAGAKIMDFGVARIASSQLTRTGVVMGTPNYISPEQVKGEDVDGRSDQFSLGVISYELLTGKKPFQAENLTATIFKIVSSNPVRPRQWNPTISPLLDETILRALNKNPLERFATCSEFAEAFAAAVNEMRTAGATVVMSDGLPDFDDGDETTGTLSIQEDIAGVRARLDDALTVGGTESAHEAPSDEPTAASDEQAAQSTKKPQKVEQPEEEHEPEKASPRLPESTRKIVASEPSPEQAADAETPSALKSEKKSRWPLAILLLLFAALSGLGFVLFNNPSLLDDSERLMQVILEPVTDFLNKDPEPVDEPITLIPAAPEPEFVQDEDPGVVVAEESAQTEPATDAPASESDPPVTEPEAEQPPLTPVDAPVASTQVGSQAGLQTVTFASNVAGAQITVDRKAEWTCTVPCEPMQLPRGSHTATVTRDGYSSQRKSFDVEEEAIGIFFSLQSMQAILVVSSRPIGGDIYIDGLKMGQRTPARVSIKPGRRVVRVVKGDLSAEQAVEAESDTLHSLSFTLGNQ